MITIGWIRLLIVFFATYAAGYATFFIQLTTKDDESEE